MSKIPPNELNDGRHNEYWDPLKYEKKQEYNTYSFVLLKDIACNGTKDFFKNDAEFDQHSNGYTLRWDELCLLHFNGEEKSQALQAQPSSIEHSQIRKHEIIDQCVATLLNGYLLSQELTFLINSPLYSIMAIGKKNSSVGSCEFEVIGLIMYSFSPSIGTFVPLVIVREQYRGQNVGISLFIYLQYFFIKLFKCYRILVWLAHDKSDSNTHKESIFSFYHKMGFYPTAPSNWPISYFLQRSIVENMHEYGSNAGTNNFLLCTHKEISKHVQAEGKVFTTQSGLRIIEKLRCDSCGMERDDEREKGLEFFSVCRHNLKRSKHILTSKGKQNNKKDDYNICGIVMCLTCSNSFGKTNLKSCCIHDSNPVLLSKQVTSKVINASYTNILRCIKDSNLKHQFFSGYLENFHGFIENDSVAYKHSLIQKNYFEFREELNMDERVKIPPFDFTTFWKYYFINTPSNENNPHTKLCNVINGENDLRNFDDMMQCNSALFKHANIDIKFGQGDDEEILLHPIGFDSNSSKPSSIAQNSVFGIRTIDGFGDCGYLSVLFGLLSFNDDFTKKITETINKYINKQYDFLKKYYGPQHTKRKKRKRISRTASSKSINRTTLPFYEDKVNIKATLTLQNLREAFLWSKFDIKYLLSMKNEFNRDFILYQYEDILSTKNGNNILINALIARQKDICEAESGTDNEKGKVAPVTTKDNYKTSLEKIRTGSLKCSTTHSQDKVIWMDDSDVLALVHITNGDVGVIMSQDQNDPRKNDHTSCSIIDGGYYTTFGKHLFQSTRYFIFLRYSNNSHYDTYYDRIHHRSLCLVGSFKEEEKSNPEYAAFYSVLNMVNSETYWLLTGQRKNIPDKSSLMKVYNDEIFNELPKTDNHMKFEDCKNYFHSFIEKNEKMTDNESALINIVNNLCLWYKIAYDYVHKDQLNNNNKEIDKDQIATNLFKQELLNLEEKKNYFPVINSSNQESLDDPSKFLKNLLLIKKIYNGETSDSSMFNICNCIGQILEENGPTESNTSSSYQFVTSEALEKSIKEKTYRLVQKQDLLQYQQICMYHLYNLHRFKAGIFYNDLFKALAVVPGSPIWMCNDKMKERCRIMVQLSGSHIQKKNYFRLYGLFSKKTGESKEEHDFRNDCLKYIWLFGEHFTVLDLGDVVSKKIDERYSKSFDFNFIMTKTTNIKNLFTSIINDHTSDNDLKAFLRTVATALVNGIWKPLLKDTEGFDSESEYSETEQAGSTPGSPTSILSSSRKIGVNTTTSLSLKRKMVIGKSSKKVPMRSLNFFHFLKFLSIYEENDFHENIESTPIITEDLYNGLIIFVFLFKFRTAFRKYLLESFKETFSQMDITQITLRIKQEVTNLEHITMWYMGYSRNEWRRIFQNLLPNNEDAIQETENDVDDLTIPASVSTCLSTYSKSREYDLQSFASEIMKVFQERNKKAASVIVTGKTLVQEFVNKTNPYVSATKALLRFLQDTEFFNKTTYSQPTMLDVVVETKPLFQYQASTIKKYVWSNTTMTQNPTDFCFQIQQYQQTYADVNNLLLSQDGLLNEKQMDLCISIFMKEQIFRKKKSNNLILCLKTQARELFLENSFQYLLPQFYEYDDISVDLFSRYQKIFIPWFIKKTKHYILFEINTINKTMLIWNPFRTALYKEEDLHSIGKYIISMSMIISMNKCKGETLEERLKVYTFDKKTTKQLPGVQHSQDSSILILVIIYHATTNNIDNYVLPSSGQEYLIFFRQFLFKLFVHYHGISNIDEHLNSQSQEKLVQKELIKKDFVKMLDLQPKLIRKTVGSVEMSSVSTAKTYEDEESKVNEVSTNEKTQNKANKKIEKTSSTTKTSNEKNDAEEQLQETESDESDEDEKEPTPLSKRQLRLRKQMPKTPRNSLAAIASRKQHTNTPKQMGINETLREISQKLCCLYICYIEQEVTNNETLETETKERYLITTSSKTKIIGSANEGTLKFYDIDHEIVNVWLDTEHNNTYDLFDGEKYQFYNQKTQIDAYTKIRTEIYDFMYFLRHDEEMAKWHEIPRNFQLELNAYYLEVRKSFAFWIMDWHYIKYKDDGNYYVGCRYKNQTILEKMVIDMEYFNNEGQQQHVAAARNIPNKMITTKFGVAIQSKTPLIFEKLSKSGKKYPSISFQQGKKFRCFPYSLKSALRYKSQCHQRSFNKTNNEDFQRQHKLSYEQIENIIQCIGTEIETPSIIPNKYIFLMKTIMEKNGWQFKRLDKNKAYLKTNPRKQMSFFDEVKNDICLLQLNNEEMDNNHWVCVTGNLIFDSNEEYAVDYCERNIELLCPKTFKELGRIYLLSEVRVLSTNRLYEQDHRSRSLSVSSKSILGRKKSRNSSESEDDSNQIISTKPKQKRVRFDSKQALIKYNFCKILDPLKKTQVQFLMEKRLFYEKQSDKNILRSIYGTTLQGKGADTITVSSFNRLDEGKWINDEIINFYFKLLQMRDTILCNSGERKRQSYFFNTFLNTQLSDNVSYQYTFVKRWSKHVPGQDIFALDKIFFPINISGLHWALVVANMQLKQIVYFDSLYSDYNSTKYCNAIFEYIKNEHTHKKGTDLSNEWKICQQEESMPQQQNGYDCGVFVCVYGDLIACDKPLHFTTINMCRERIKYSILRKKCF